MTFIFHFQERLSKDKTGVKNQGITHPGFYSRHHTTWMVVDFYMRTKACAWIRKGCFEEGVKKRGGGRAGESWGAPSLCVSRIQTQLLGRRGSSKQAHQLISPTPSFFPSKPPYPTLHFATFPAFYKYSLAFLLNELTPIHLPNIKRGATYERCSSNYRSGGYIFLKSFSLVSCYLLSLNQIPQVLSSYERYVAGLKGIPALPPVLSSISLFGPLFEYFGSPFKMGTLLEGNTCPPSRALFH